MQTLAEQRGGKCLAKKFIDDYAPLKWRCAKGHTWDAGYYLISRDCDYMIVQKQSVKRNSFKSLLPMPQQEVENPLPKNLLITTQILNFNVQRGISLKCC